MSSLRQKISQITQQEMNSQYDYKEMIDAGSYGVVFRYLDKKTNAQVAIKFLRDEEKLDTFQNQFQIMKNVDHPNVLKCLRFCYNISNNKYLLVMPYCEKNNLKKCLPQIQTFDEKFKLWLCVQMARGIKALHDVNIMHRDIKPANILIDENWTVKLCDFGFGRIDEDQQKTQKVGTPLYIDPNVNSGNYSKKCDIYSLGLVMDTVFRGKSCYNNVPRQKFPQQLLYFKQNKQKIIKQLGCNQEIKKIILDCLKNNQSDRLDANQLLQRLEIEYSKLDPTFIVKISQNQFSLTNSQQHYQKNVKKLQKMIQDNQQIQKQQKKRSQTLKNLSKPFIQQYSDSNQQKNQYNKAQKYLNKTQKQHRQHKQHQQHKQHKQEIYQQLKQLSQKKIKNTKIYVKLFNLRNNLDQSVQKNSNFQIIYTYFINKINKIRQLQNFKEIISIPKRDQKIIIFIALFGYLRFLKVHKNFLNNKNGQNQYISSIKGIPIQKISQKTIQLTLNLIQSEIQCTKKLIKPFLLQLNADKSLYKQQILSKVVLKMITDGIQRKFIGIEELSSQAIQKQYQKLLLSERYIINSSKQNQNKQKLKQISEIF